MHLAYEDANGFREDKFANVGLVGSLFSGEPAMEMEAVEDEQGYGDADETVQQESEQDGVRQRGGVELRLETVDQRVGVLAQHVDAAGAKRGDHQGQDSYE